MVMAEDVEKGKPHPDPYLQGAKNCHVDPTKCKYWRFVSLRGSLDYDYSRALGLVVEDAVSGLKAGRAAGAKVLGVCTSSPRTSVEKGEPDFIVEDLTK